MVCFVAAYVNQTREPAPLTRPPPLHFKSEFATILLIRTEVRQLALLAIFQVFYSSPDGRRKTFLNNTWLAQSDSQR